MVRALSPGKLSSYKEGAQISGVWTSSWPKMKAQNRTFPRSCVALACPRSCCFSSPHSHLCRVLSAEFRNQDVFRQSLGKVLLGRVDTCPLAGKVARCLEPEKGAASEVLWLPSVPEAVSFCSPHSHLCRLLSAEYQIQDVSR